MTRSRLTRKIRSSSTPSAVLPSPSCVSKNSEIVNLKADAIACYRPANSQELFAVERIALCQQAIFRGYRLEAGLFTTALDYCLNGSGRTFRPMTADLVGDGDTEITRAQNRNYAVGEGVRTLSIESDVWPLLIRYKVNADRQYRRAVEDYECVKRLRPEMPNQPVDPKPENIDDDFASFAELGRSYLDHQPPVTTRPRRRATRSPSPWQHSQSQRNRLYRTRARPISIPLHTSVASQPRPKPRAST